MSHDSDIAVQGRWMKERRKILRRVHGVKCPVCTVKLPKAQPTILLPRQQCQVCRYNDQRPRLTEAEHEEVARQADEAE